MRYQIQRALLTEQNEIINLGNSIRVEMNDGTIINCMLFNIYWLNEYEAIIYTDKGDICLTDVKRIFKLEVA